MINDILKRLEDNEHLDTGMVDLGGMRVFIVKEIQSLLTTAIDEMEKKRRPEEYKKSTMNGRIFPVHRSAKFYNQAISECQDVLRNLLK